MDSGDLFKWGLVGAVAYWIYTQYTASDVAAPAVGTTAGAPSQSVTVALPTSTEVQRGVPATPRCLPAASVSGWNAEQTARMRALPDCSFVDQNGQLVANSAAAWAALESSGTSAAQPAAGGMDALYQAIQTAASGDTAVVNGAAPGDVWNYYANRITGKQNPPNWPSGPITLAQYWATMAPNIRAATGLAGLGLYGSLASLVAQYSPRGWN